MGRNGVLELIIIIVIVIIIEPYRTKISLLRHRTRHIVVQLNDTVGPKFTGVESQSIPSKKSTMSLGYEGAVKPCMYFITIALAHLS